MESNNKVKSIIKDFNDGKAANAFFQIADLIKNNPENLDYLFLYAKMCNQVNKLDESEKASLFLVSKNKNSVLKFVNSLKLFAYGYSWGGFESLALQQEFRELGKRNYLKLDKDEHLVRLHIGLEDPKDLIEDLRKAIKLIK